jgi:hypothetical protein
MAVEYPYTSEDAIIALAGQLAIDLRTDDVPDLDAHMEAAIDTGTSDLDFYLADYSQAGTAWPWFHSRTNRGRCARGTRPGEPARSRGRRGRGRNCPRRPLPARQPTPSATRN